MHVLITLIRTQNHFYESKTSYVTLMANANPVTETIELKYFFRARCRPQRACVGHETRELKSDR